MYHADLRLYQAGKQRVGHSSVSAKRHASFMPWLQELQAREGELRHFNDGIERNSYPGFCGWTAENVVHG